MCLAASDGDRAAVEVVLLRPIEGLGFLRGEAIDRVDAVTPYGYGGPAFSPAAASDPTFRRAFAGAVSDWLRANGVVSRFVRFHPLLGNAADAGDRVRVRAMQPTVYVDLTDDPESGLATAARRSLRRAEAEGLAFRVLSPCAAMELFVDLYEQTMRRVDARPYYFFPRSYYASLAAGLGERLRLFAVFAGETLAAAALYMVGSAFAHYHLGASSAEHLALRPNHLLMVEAARRFRAEGLTALHLGGGLSGEDSLYRYKATLGTGRAVFSVGREVADEEAYADLVGRWERWAGRSADPDGYFPAYRAPQP